MNINYPYIIAHHNPDGSATATIHSEGRVSNGFAKTRASLLLNRKHCDCSLWIIKAVGKEERIYRSSTQLDVEIPDF
jgi:hypothetical protein